MGRLGDEVICFEGRIEHATAKARLIDMTLGGQVWLPISQTIAMSEPDIDGNREFQVTAWWAGKNGLA